MRAMFNGLRSKQKIVQVAVTPTVHPTPVHVPERTPIELFWINFNQDNAEFVFNTLTTSNIIPHVNAPQNAPQKDGNTLLMLAAQFKYNKIMQMLITHKDTLNLNLNLKNKDSNTALIIAIKAGNQKACRALLDAGADIHHVNTDEDNALLQAGYASWTDIYEELLDKGAEIPSVHLRPSNANQYKKNLFWLYEASAKGGHFLVIKTLLSLHKARAINLNHDDMNCILESAINGKHINTYLIIEQVIEDYPHSLSVLKSTFESIIYKLLVNDIPEPHVISIANILIQHNIDLSQPLRDPKGLSMEYNYNEVREKQIAVCVGKTPAMLAQDKQYHALCTLLYNINTNQPPANGKLSSDKPTRTEASAPPLVPDQKEQSSVVYVAYIPCTSNDAFAEGVSNLDLSEAQSTPAEVQPVLTTPVEECSNECMGSVDALELDIRRFLVSSQERLAHLNYPPEFLLQLMQTSMGSAISILEQASQLKIEQPAPISGVKADRPSQASVQTLVGGTGVFAAPPSSNQEIPSARKVAALSLC